MKLLVHACCGPCSIMPTRLLREAGHDIAVFYANSNISPASEYAHRLSELRSYAQAHDFEVMEGSYDPASWERVVAPIGEALKPYSPAFGAAYAEGAIAEGGDELGSPAPASVAELLDDERREQRCRACYRLRLEEAARTAADGGFDALTTTLAVSPYQFTEVIREELDRACERFGIPAHFEDWRGHYDEATRISRELGMYRQNYCGCRFSVQEGAATRAFVKQQRKALKEAKRLARAQEERQRQERAAEKQAYARKQERKRAVLKQLRGKGQA